jgi:hypothetical protein
MAQESILQLWETCFLLGMGPASTLCYTAVMYAGYAAVVVFQLGVS